MREQKKHLASKRLETLEKWRRRYAASLNMEFATARGRSGGGVGSIGSAHVCRRPLRIHTSFSARRNWFQKKKKRKRHVDVKG